MEKNSLTKIEALRYLALHFRPRPTPPKAQQEESAQWIAQVLAGADGDASYWLQLLQDLIKLDSEYAIRRETIYWRVDQLIAHELRDAMR